MVLDVHGPQLWSCWDGHSTHYYWASLSKAGCQYLVHISYTRDEYSWINRRGRSVCFHKNSWTLLTILMSFTNKTGGPRLRSFTHKKGEHYSLFWWALLIKTDEHYSLIWWALVIKTGEHYSLIWWALLIKTGEHYSLIWWALLIKTGEHYSLIWWALLINTGEHYSLIWWALLINTGEHYSLFWWALFTKTGEHYSLF